jgi:hypothetical protein
LRKEFLPGEWIYKIPLSREKSKERELDQAQRLFEAILSTSKKLAFAAA